MDSHNSSSVALCPVDIVLHSTVADAVQTFEMASIAVVERMSTSTVVVERNIQERRQHYSSSAHTIASSPIHLQMVDYHRSAMMMYATNPVMAIDDFDIDDARWAIVHDLMHVFDVVYESLNAIDC